ncbi:FTR1 family protein [Uliginosibacterium sp. H3]|uniref:FTR1 family protein n=1 Tax=Uliginosibacterium silvisoli TaxID=3114758 RepID=A0ABU6JX89_9RHOO|nr:FTR1 family protein [Uliginosibacterium sp. H3]
MLGTAIILFREVLEAALIIGIIAAATRGVRNRGLWIAGGVTLGIAGSCFVAAFAGSISNLAEGVGQELFNAGILGIAVVMLSWHNIWMARHGKELAAQASAVGKSVGSGAESVTVLLTVIGLAVLREGSEVVLFLYGLIAQGGTTVGSMVLGGVLGMLAGVAVGTALYFGLLRIPLRWFFQATSLLILLLAAGMAGQAARLLIQADKLPSLADPLWDVSGILPGDSALGTVLHALAGYDPQPTGMHMLFYVVTFIVVLIGMRLAAPKK